MEETSVPVAEALTELGIPFVVASALGGRAQAYPVFRGRPNVGKPTDPAKLLTTLKSLLGYG